MKDMTELCWLKAILLIHGLYTGWPKNWQHFCTPRLYQ